MNNKEKILKIHKFVYHTALKRLRTIILFLPTIVFLSVFLILAYVNRNIQQETQKLMLPKPIFSDFRVKEYPVMQFNISDTSSNLTAEGAIIMDAGTKKILYAKNPKRQFSMASSTKIMTALVALEYYRPDAILTMKAANVPPAIVGYGVGEKVRFMDMLYGLMLPSGNDAALAIAENYPGGVPAFITAMNKKAHELSLYNTHFADSSGLDDRDYTTVVDLARLAAEAIKIPTLRTVVGTKEKRTSNADSSKTYPLVNINELLGTYGVNGIKTGYTPNAGGILVTSSVQNGHTVIIVVMKSTDRFGDTEKLLKLLKDNITYLSILP